MASGVSYSKEAPSKFPKPGDAPRRVKVIDNEEIHPPKEFILNHTIKTLDQVSSKKSNILFFLNLNLLIFSGITQRDPNLTIDIV
jgi:hypothetical protein